MTRAFGGTERQLWLKVLSRGARPAILMGFRLGLIRAVTGMITMELLLMALGVGRLILDFQGNFEAGYMYATVFVVIAEAVLLARLCERLEMRAVPWAERAVIE
jgi:ABC-type nitrate/sulfonate/bicarbonate transport system permease component